MGISFGNIRHNVAPKFGKAYLIQSGGEKRELKTSEERRQYIPRAASPTSPYELLDKAKIDVLVEELPYDTVKITLVDSKNVELANPRFFPKNSLDATERYNFALMSMEALQQLASSLQNKLDLVRVALER